MNEAGHPEIRSQGPPPGSRASAPPPDPRMRRPRPPGVILRGVKKIQYRSRPTRISGQPREQAGRGQRSEAQGRATDWRLPGAAESPR